MAKRVGIAGSGRRPIPPTEEKASETSSTDGGTNVVRMRVRTDQTDVNGPMYHGAYFDCFEAARVDVFRRLGYTYARAQAEGFMPAVRRAACEYFQPAYLDDPIDIAVYVMATTAATMLLGYEARRDDRLLARGEALFVFLDRAGHPIRVPPGLIACVEQHLEILTAPSRSPSSR